MHWGSELPFIMKPNSWLHTIGWTGTISGGRYIDTFPPGGIPAKNFKLIDN